MKRRSIYSICVILALTLGGCNHETAPDASENLGFSTIFGPAADADPIVKQLYRDYGIWVRMDFDSISQVTNGILGGESNKCSVGKIEDVNRASALIFMRTLMSNVSKEYAKKYFPLEFFFVKKYVAGWPKGLVQLGLPPTFFNYSHIIKNITQSPVFTVV